MLVKPLPSLRRWVPVWNIPIYMVDVYDVRQRYHKSEHKIPLISESGCRRGVPFPFPKSHGLVKSDFKSNSPWGPRVRSRSPLSQRPDQAEPGIYLMTQHTMEFYRRGQ